MENEDRSRLYIWISAFFFFFALYVTAPIIAAYAKELSSSSFLTGVTVASYGAAMVLARIPIGILASMHGRRKGLIQLGLFSIFFGLLLAFFNNSLALVVSRVLLGFGAGFWVLYTVLFAAYFKKEDLTKAMSVITLAYALPQIGAALIGGYVAEELGWLAPFGAGLALTTLAMLFLARAREVKTAGHRFSIARSMSVFSGKLALVSFAAMIAFFIAFATAYGFTQTWAVERFGAEGTELGLLLFAMLVPYVIFLRFAERIQKVFSTVPAVGLGLLCVGASAFAIPFAQSMEALMSLQGLMGAGFGLIYPITMAEAVRGVEEHLKDEAMGIYQTVYALGIFLGPFMGGVIASSYGLVWVFWAAGLLSAAAFLIFAMFHFVLQWSNT